MKSKNNVFSFFTLREMNVFRNQTKEGKNERSAAHARLRLSRALDTAQAEPQPPLPPLPPWGIWRRFLWRRSWGIPPFRCAGAGAGRTLPFHSRRRLRPPPIVLFAPPVLRPPGPSQPVERVVHPPRLLSLLSVPCLPLVGSAQGHRHHGALPLVLVLARAFQGLPGVLPADRAARPQREPLRDALAVEDVPARQLRADVTLLKGLHAHGALVLVPLAWLGLFGLRGTERKYFEPVDLRGRESPCGVPGGALVDLLARCERRRGVPVPPHRPPCRPPNADQDQTKPERDDVERYEILFRRYGVSSWLIPVGRGVERILFDGFALVP
mmetsp:Transcript_2083/g.7583  ORF Transcript_2083/g.7583 Transcript_2083/m.7583 type:complete len:326 (+) Transcript_2083:1069-2046(+)